MKSNWRSAYIYSSAGFQTVMWLSAAYFHNWWSVVFVVLAICQSERHGSRVNSWQLTD